MSHERGSDAMTRVFDDAARARFREYLLAPSLLSADKPNLQHVRALAELLGVTRPTAGDDEELAAELVADLRERSAAIAAYLSAADAYGLLDEDTVRRLRSTEERDFRSARAECVAAWFLGYRLGLRVEPRVDSGHERKRMALGATTPQGPLAVEVRAPRVDLVDGRDMTDDNVAAVANDIRDAAEQFGEGTRNLVVLVPRISKPFLLFRRPVPELAPHPRVSAVLTIESLLVIDRDRVPRIDHRVLVFHNPNAEQPIAPETFGDHPQLVGGMWTDRKEPSEG